MLTMPRIRLRCPRCHRPLEAPTDTLPVACAGCGESYRSRDGIPVLLPAVVDEDWRHVFEHVFRTATSSSGQMLYRFDRQHEIMIATYRRLLEGLPPGRLILDVGCGHGQMAAPLVTQHRVVGVDFLALGLAAARARGLTVFQADAGALPFIDGQFDAVICAEVFQNLADIRGVLAELGRACRPDGLVIVSTLNRASLLRRLARALRGLRRGPPNRAEEIIKTAHQRTAAEVAAAAEDCSLLALRTVTWTHFPARWTSTTRSPRYGGAALATNVILTFERRGRPAEAR
jgi:ubiquinone/menaquinone biosynthesis C-methylase UbiE/uncharacterized protein YbaR (Trm112 family)